MPSSYLVLSLLVVNLICLILLLLRARGSNSPAESDPRLLQLPDAIAALHSSTAARFNAIDNNATQEREAAHRTSAALRTEITGSITTLGSALNTGLDTFRRDNATSAADLRTAVQQNLDTLTQRLNAATSDAARHHLDAREALNTKLSQLAADSTASLEAIRSTVEARLTRLNLDNAAKLDEMRATVDEKLQSTLQTRLTESFGQVTDQLTKVHSGLGEMTRLSEGVNDLSRIFTNVKSRGGFAEVQLGMLLEQMLAPSQFVRNARVRPNTQEVVEFAVRFPGHSGETLLPIDAKFPREDWERLEAAYESNDPEALTLASRAFESAIRTEAKRICEKYINPPVTTPHAIMFLPTEGLYAEVMRRDSLQAEIQSRCQVTIAGPSTLSAILTSFQMGFHMLAIQEKGDEVWKLLASTKTEFGKFGGLLAKVEKQVDTVQNTLREIGGKTTTINRALKDVSSTESAPTTSNLLAFEEIAAILPVLAANGTSEEV